MTDFARTIVCIIAAVFIGNCAYAQDANTTNTKLFDYHTTKLANGLEIITLEDFSTPIVSVQVWYHVGSKNEQPDRQGFAHMFEHMMFKGTDLIGETDHFNLIRQVGGSSNGYTSFDHTVYLETIPANQVELAMWLEADRMAFLKIDQQRFNTERNVVEEERRMRLNEPYGTLMEKVLPEIFTNHPYRWAPIGKIPQLRAASVKELRDFWKKYYVPSNATLIIVGAIKHQDATKLAEKYFGWIPKYPKPAAVDQNEPAIIARTAIIKEDNAPAPLVGVLFKSAPSSSKDDVPLTLLAEILGGGQSSRLYRVLVAQKQLAVNVVAEDYALEQAGVFGAGAVMTPFAADPNAVLNIIEQEIAKLRTEPVTERELTKARNQLLKSVVTETLSVESKATMLGKAALDQGDVARVNELIPEIRSATAQDLLRVAQKYLAPEHRIDLKVQRNLAGTLSALTGKKKIDDGQVSSEIEKVAPPAGRGDVNRPAYFPTKPPLNKNILVPQSPKYISNHLENGLKVIVVPNHEVPFVSIRLGLLAGAWTEKNPGSTSMAMQMLTRGTAKHNEEQLSDELETFAIGLGGKGEMDSSVVSANCVTDQLDRAMSFMSEVVLAPTFPQDEFAKLKSQVLTSLAISTAEPEYIAEQAYKRVLYGKHPYARTDTGDISDVNSLAISNLLTWYSTAARPDKACLIFAGDINEPRAMQLAKKWFGTWTRPQESPAVTLPEIPEVNTMHIYLVDNPGVQSRIRIGAHGLTRQSPDYFTSRVVSDYFGFGFNSRLNESVRVRKGLTYGIWGGFIAKRFAGEFTVDTFTKSASTAEAVAAVLEAVQQLKTEAPSEDEVSKSKSYIAGSFLERRETPQQIADDIWLVESNGLAPDYFEKLLEGVSKTQPGDCVRVINKNVDPNAMAIVVVGDANSLKSKLEKIAPVTMFKVNE